MLYISICFTLAVILFALRFLAKVKTEMLGAFYRWITLLVLAIAGLVLVCQLARGVGRMRHHIGKDCSEGSCNEGGMKNDHSARNGRMGGMNHSCEMQGMGKEGGCPMMDQCPEGMSKEACMMKCKKMRMSDCKEGMANCKMHGAGLTHSESTTDTIDGKIIKKEIEIIEKK